MSKRKIVAYTAFIVDGIKSVTDQDSEKIAGYFSEGWQPWGSPVVSGALVIQAIVKYEPEPTPPTPDSQLLTILADALNVLTAEASHHERLILALEHAQRRGYVTTALVELEKAHQLDREAIVLRAKQEGWVK